MKKITFLAAIALVGLALSFASCKKDSTDGIDLETQSSTDNYLADNQINDELKQVDEAAANNKLGKAGPTVIIDSTSTPRVMTIDYGTGTICNDGKQRSGKLIVTWTGRYRDVGTVITITTDNFFQNGNQIEGTKTITNQGRNTSGNLTYSISVSGSKIKTVDGKSRTWNSTRTREWIAGENTPTPTDDVYLITGTANGVNANGLSYTANITQALRFDLSCQYRLTAGEIELTPQGKQVRIINYGSGTCDNTYTVKVGNKLITITR